MSLLPKEEFFGPGIPDKKRFLGQTQLPPNTPNNRFPSVFSRSKWKEWKEKGTIIRFSFFLFFFFFFSFSFSFSFLFFSFLFFSFLFFSFLFFSFLFFSSFFLTHFQESQCRNLSCFRNPVFPSFFPLFLFLFFFFFFFLFFLFFPFSFPPLTWWILPLNGF